MNEVRRPDDYEILLSNELVRLYKTMYEASPLKEIIDVMALKYDYHNIKVLVKGKILDKDFSQMLIPVGMVGVNDLKSAINGEDFGRLPKKMEECLRKIFEKFEETNDPQFIDLIADQYLYAHIHEIANKKNIKDKALDRYLTNLIDLNNVKTLLRAKKQDKNVNFFLDAIVPGGSIDASKFRSLYLDTIENIPNNLSSKEYSQVLREGIASYIETSSVSEFEKLIDNHIMSIMKEAKIVTKGLEPVLTYMYVKENEIKQIRTIMVGKLNNITKEVIRERCVMDMYKKIGVVGDKDSVLAFKALGIDVFPVVEDEEARKTIDKLAMTDYAVIFVTEHVAKNIEETIERYTRQVLPAVILIPSNQGTLNIGKQRISDNVEKAVGVNIL